MSLDRYTFGLKEKKKREKISKVFSSTSNTYCLSWLKLDNKICEKISFLKELYGQKLAKLVGDVKS